MELFDLHGKVAIVTGGNGGLGRGMAIGLASAGADIVIAARNQAKTAATATELRARYGVQVLELSVDVSCRHPGEQRRYEHPQTS